MDKRTDCLVAQRVGLGAMAMDILCKWLRNKEIS
jgi:hypothetical protein